MTHFIWFMTSYTIGQTCVPHKVRRSPKLGGVRHSTFYEKHGPSCTKNPNLSIPEYLWQGEISVCKVLVLIKIMLVKNDYFFYPKFKLHRYFGFLNWHSFYWKNMARVHCPANTNLNLIRSTYSKPNLVIESPAILLLLILSVQRNITTWKQYT